MSCRMHSRPCFVLGLSFGRRSHPRQYLVSVLPNKDVGWIYHRDGIRLGIYAIHRMQKGIESKYII